MTLRQKIEQDLVTAQKNKDVVRLETLRFLLSAIQYKEVDTKVILSDPEVVEVVGKQVKTHKESIEAFKKGQRSDLVAREEAQLKILLGYLPEQMSEDDLRSLIGRKIKELEAGGGKLGVGAAMRAVMPTLKGQAEGGLVKKIVEEFLKVA